MSQRGNLRVRYYPEHGHWMCVVQRMGADGMPEDDDLVSAVGASKVEARDAAIAKTDDADVRAVLSHDEPR